MVDQCINKPDSVLRAVACDELFDFGQIFTGFP